MGFKAVDFSTPGSIGPTPLTPPGKDVLVKAFQVARTDTSAVLKAVLPWGASILEFTISGVASDAATTATISIGSTSSSNEYINGQDVKGAGTFIRPTVVGTAVVQTEGIPNTGTDTPIYAKYAETGTASTVGSWKVVVYYVL